MRRGKPDCSLKLVMEHIVLDGAAVFQMLNPGQSKTFADYAETIFLPYVHFQLQNVN